MPKQIRWGILSTAKIGVRAVIPAIQASSNGVVAAIASRDLQAAQDAAKALNIPQAYGSYQALLESPDIDAVYIPLPNHLHAEWTIQAARQRKHILCEKPFALNAIEAGEMVDAAKENQVQLMEAFMYRFHPQYAKIKQLLAEHVVGKIQIIRIAFCFTLNRPNDIRLNKEMGGGAVMDVGCYCVNLARLIADAEPIEVQGKAIFGKTGVDMTLAGLLRFSNNIIATFECSFESDYTEWLQIQGTEGRLDIPRPIKPMLNPAEIIVRRGEKSDAMATLQTHTVPGANHYQLMVEHFADAILNGKPMQFPAEDARANMRVLDGLLVSAGGI